MFVTAFLPERNHRVFGWSGCWKLGKPRSSAIRNDVITDVNPVRSDVITDEDAIKALGRGLSRAKKTFSCHCSGGEAERTREEKKKKKNGGKKKIWKKKEKEKRKRKRKNGKEVIVTELLTLGGAARVLRHPRLMTPATWGR